MTNPACYDPATEVIHTVLAAMRAVFSPTSECPPLGGGSTKVWFFAGEGAPISEVNCNDPMLWVRLASRYRSEMFPDHTMVPTPCGGMQVLVVEVGVARCALADEGSIDEYTDEARIGLDDCWRLGKVACLVAGDLPAQQVGSDTITPYGPEGGIIAWTTTLYISV
jgi:hypothetical protein